MNYAFHLLIYLSIYSIVSLSLNLVVGYCGLLSLAHAGYFALGCYAYALATLKLGWAWLPASALGIALAVLLSLAVSLPARRFKGDFFVLMSLAVQAGLVSLFINWGSQDAEWGSWRNLTNGPFGIAGIPKPVVFGIKVTDLGSLAVFSVLLASVCALVVWLLVSSPWGRLLKSTRDDELAARGLGKSVHWARTQAFAVACGMVAVAGSIYASYVAYIEPSSGGLDHSILMLSMVLVGGTGNFRGPLVGAAVLLAIPELLRLAHVPISMSANVRLAAYGALLVLLMHLRPQGLAGEYRVQ